MATHNPNQPPSAEPNWIEISEQLDIAETQRITSQLHAALEELADRVKVTEDSRVLPDGSTETKRNYYIEVEAGEEAEGKEEKGDSKRRIEVAPFIGKRLKDYVEIGPVFGVEPEPTSFDEYVASYRAREEAGMSKNQLKELEEEKRFVTNRLALANRLGFDTEVQPDGQSFAALYGKYKDNESWRQILEQAGTNYKNQLARFGYKKDIDADGNEVMTHRHGIIASRYVQLLKLGMGRGINFDDPIKLAEKLNNDQKWERTLNDYAEKFTRFVQNAKVRIDGREVSEAHITDAGQLEYVQRMKRAAISRYYDALSRGLITYVDTSTPRNALRFLSDDKLWGAVAKKAATPSPVAPLAPHHDRTTTFFDKKTLKKMHKVARRSGFDRKSLKQLRKADKGSGKAPHRTKPNYAQRGHMVYAKEYGPVPAPAPAIHIPTEQQDFVPVTTSKQSRFQSQRRKNARDLIAQDEAKAARQREREDLLKEFVDLRRTQAASPTSPEPTEAAVPTEESGLESEDLEAKYAYFLNHESLERLDEAIEQAIRDEAHRRKDQRGVRSLPTDEFRQMAREIREELTSDYLDNGDEDLPDEVKLEVISRLRNLRKK